ncbi:hypothetical protein BDW74DRAFT_184117 [Aspergillus multicolor]|uniref:uncharacterized protein n=1 Tax=Aspergillus multicolor TaxID=41759 RepID=UPI003CCCF882
MSFLYPVTDLATVTQQTQTSWGLAIYRTTYTPLSDLHFDTIQSYIEIPEGTETPRRPYTNENFFIVVDEDVVRALAGLCEQITLAQLQEGCMAHEPLASYAKTEDSWVMVVETELWNEGYKGWIKCNIFALWNLWSDINGDEGMCTWEAMAMGSDVYFG